MLPCADAAPCRIESMPGIPVSMPNASVAGSSWEGGVPCFECSLLRPPPDPRLVTAAKDLRDIERFPHADCRPLALDEAPGSAAPFVVQLLEPRTRAFHRRPLSEQVAGRRSDAMQTHVEHARRAVVRARGHRTHRSNRLHLRD